MKALGNAPAGAPVEVRGQVVANQPFGRALEELVQRDDVRVLPCAFVHRARLSPPPLHARAPFLQVHAVLELGTWYGGGASLCIARGLKASNDAGGDKVLVTVEPFEPAHTYARATLVGFPVRLILGTTLPASELPSADAAARRARVEKQGLVWLGVPKDSRRKGWDYTHVAKYGHVSENL